jgi:C-terminal processing protease CtpA/Prc
MKELFFLMFFLVTIGFVSGQKANKIDDVKMERIATHIRLWGDIKYFSPTTSQRSRNWDSAFLNTINLIIENDKDAKKYVFLDSMLTYSGDSQIKIIPNRLANGDSCKPMTIKNINDSVLLFSIPDFNYILFNYYLASRCRREFIEKSLRSKYVVVDLRTVPIYDECYGVIDKFFSEEIVSQISKKNFSTFSKLRLQYHGFPSQTFGVDDTYFDNVVVKPSRIIAGDTTLSYQPHFCFITNENSQVPEFIYEMAKSHENLSFIHDGDNYTKVTLGEANISRIDSKHSVLVPKEVAFDEEMNRIFYKPDTIYSGELSQQFLSEILPRHFNRRRGQNDAEKIRFSSIPLDESYLEKLKLEPNFRLLALARIYNVIRIFYPFASSIKSDWDSLLRVYIPLFAKASTNKDYLLNVRALYSNINDSHGIISGKLNGDVLGRGFVPFETSYIEGKFVITSIKEDTLNREGNKQIKIGDIVTGVNGVDIAALVRANKEILSASSSHAFYDQIQNYLFRGNLNDTIVITAKRRDVAPRNIKFLLAKKSTIIIDDYRTFFRDTTLIFQQQGKKIAYVNMAKIERSQVEKFLKDIPNTSGIIFDIRGYPNGTVYDIMSPFLQTKIDLLRSDILIVEGKPRYLNSNAAPEYQIESTIQNDVPAYNKYKYSGKVIVLINEKAQSLSEHVALFLKRAFNATLVGSPTVGADGNVTSFSIPGGLELYFTGMEIKSITGESIQNIGVLPDAFVYPTLKGVANKKDLVMEKAIEIIMK